MTFRLVDADAVAHDASSCCRRRRGREGKPPLLQPAAITVNSHGARSANLRFWIASFGEDKGNCAENLSS